jgi:hypothetical protein
VLGTTVAYVTWSDIGSQVSTALDSYDNPDPSTVQGVHRIGHNLIDAVTSHN